MSQLGQVVQGHGLSLCQSSCGMSAHVPPTQQLIAHTPVNQQFQTQPCSNNQTQPSQVLSSTCTSVDLESL